ncbi:MAG: hypothetical protein JO147_00205, partial [Actinobacteria bacterium]|nr:hypothetical protein [Actinomycetota bacterium]
MDDIDEQSLGSTAGGDEVATPLADHPRRPRLATVLRGVGQTLVTAGLVVLLFVAYELWITNIFTHAEQHKIHNKLVQKWAS